MKKKDGSPKTEAGRGKKKKAGSPKTEAGRCLSFSILQLWFNFGLPTSDFGLPTSDFGLPTSDFGLPTPVS